MSHAPRPPRIDRLSLPKLRPADAHDIGAHRRADAIEIAGLDLSGRDLSGWDLGESRLKAVAMNGTRLRDASLVEVEIDRIDAPVLTAPSSLFRRVEIRGSRFASAELYGATWRSVRFVECKIGYLNLRGANVQDVTFTDCTIDELDVTGAKLTRVAIEDTRLLSLEVHRAQLTDVDFRQATIFGVVGIEGLRGATMSPDQVRDLAPAFADKFGIRALE